MTITTHQPIFLPWSGFLYKAMNADCLVLLDNVQYPRGHGWMNRNRLKNEKGELWLTVPVKKKGKGLQSIHSVQIYNQINWQKKHLKSISQNYTHAPFINDYFHHIESIYNTKYRKLVSLNLDLIRFFWKALSLKTTLLLQSELNIGGKGSELLINICKKMNVSDFLTFPQAQKYLDMGAFDKMEIRVKYLQFNPPVYPQLWGDFIYNLSALDLILNCGPRSINIISQS
jgi:hypothetical protein